MANYLLGLMNTVKIMLIISEQGVEMNLVPATKTIKRLYFYKVVFLYLNMSKRIFYPLFLLLIPLIGMAISDEINWSVFDFIIMGFLLILLSIGINFVIKHVKNLKNRFLYIGILVLIFMLIWAELAVGIFGTPFAGN
tara:strand:+ start:186 stop:599 length:414 start_codon:yes stop_codon:yes gene_type:complete